MKIGNNGNLVLSPFDENTPCLMIVLMNCQTKLRINHLAAVKSVATLETYERMDWPARSPDLNPIEHVWDFLGRRLTARTLPPVTIRELRLALQDE
ncbi:hypothetical protein TNCV_153281 [Trichonephila clavipes]|nr:hypothetical protein TNCV_153281 [Trichonephila clavipes]